MKIDAVTQDIHQYISCLHNKYILGIDQICFSISQDIYIETLQKHLTSVTQSLE